MKETVDKHERRGRVRRIEVRVTDCELSRIRIRARRSGTSLSAYVRSSVLRNEGTPRVEIDVTLLREVHANLKHAGSNINQIARVLNTYGVDNCDHKTIESALVSISTAAEAASDLLIEARGRKGGE